MARAAAPRFVGVIYLLNRCQFSSLGMNLIAIAASSFRDSRASPGSARFARFRNASGQAPRRGSLSLAGTFRGMRFIACPS